VQVDPVQPTLKPTGTKCLKLKCDALLSNFAFKFNLRRYTMGAEAGDPKAMFNLGTCLDEGKGVAAPDHLAAAGWYRYGLADISRHVIQGALNPRLLLVTSSNAL